MNCGGVIVKYILFIFNALFAICGLVLIVFGSLILANLGNMPEASKMPNGIPIALISLGCVIFVISFLGCCGAIREDTCCTMTYAIIMLILFLCQVALIVFIWVKRGALLDAVHDSIVETWEHRKTKPDDMEKFQVDFKCCGVFGADDYLNAGEILPKSCCPKDTIACTMSVAKNVQGCSLAVKKSTEPMINIARYTGIGVALVEFVAFIFGCCLAVQTRNDRRRANY